MFDPTVLDTFLALVQIDSPSGEEAVIASHLIDRLTSLGCEAWTDSHGNVVGRRPGRGDGASLPPIILSAHMDTVVPGHGVRPRVVDGVVRSDGSTILGADDKAGLTAILTALARTMADGASSRPVELALTVQEETGLTGAKLMDHSQFVARDAIVIDSAGPVGAIVGKGPAQDSLTFEIHGKASHAGVSPEDGISAIVVAANAIDGMRLGRIDATTTANLGVIHGGMATNIIPPSVVIRGEARGIHPESLAAQVAHMRERFESAARALGATVDITVTRMYDSINLDENTPVVQLVQRAMRSVDVAPLMISTGGGSDANVMAGRGISVANLGFGVVGPHALDEHISVADLNRVADVVTAILSDVE
jgi:tripeptide aminopeptidase